MLDEDILKIIEGIESDTKQDDLENFYFDLNEALDISTKNKMLHLDSHFLNEKNDIDAHLKRNSKLIKIKGFYLLKASTLEDWRENNKRKLSIPFVSFLFRLFSFFCFRVIPRIRLMNYFKIHIFNSNKILISKAEILGRLAYNGFDIYDYRKINNYHLICVQKRREPLADKVSEGPIFTQKRIGKNGKLIHVFKLRTMHPYSEYLHDYMLKNHGFSSNGKIKDDFRMTRWAKVFRKYWFDEIPQIINLIKGDMKLIGLRPVSQTYYDLLPEELKEMRQKFKPGCIPPYVSLNMKSSYKEVLEAEMKYVNQKKNKPLSTDFVYFFKAIFNIIIKKKRSY